MLQILFGVLVSTSAIVHKQVKTTDGYTLDRENEISSESLNTGEFMPLKESIEDDYEENAGEVGYKYEVPKEVDKIEKPLLKINEKSTEKSKSQQYEPITRSPDPYISAQSSSMKFYPPSTSYGIPFYNKYPVPMKFKSVPVTPNINVNKSNHPHSYYITEKKYPKLYKEETNNMKTNSLGTFRNTNENFDYGTEDYLQGHESSQLEAYDTSVKSEFDFEKTSGNVYYIDGHEFPPEPNNYGTLFTNNHVPGQDEYNSNGFDGYKYPKLDGYEDEKKYNFPKIENAYVPKGYSYGAMKEFGEGPGNGFFFTMYPKYSLRNNEKYVYEVPLKYKSLLFNGNGQMYKKSMQFQGMKSDGFSGLHTSSEFESPWTHIRDHFTQNQEYLRPSAFQSDYGNTMHNVRKYDPSYIVYKIYKHTF